MNYHPSSFALFDRLHKDGIKYVCIGASAMKAGGKIVWSSFSIVLNPDVTNQDKFIKYLTKLGVSRNDINDTEVHTANIILKVSTPPVEIRRESKYTPNDKSGKEKRIFPVDFRQLWENKIKIPIKPRGYYLAPSQQDLSDGLVLENYLTNVTILKKMI
ncbi:MAG TPA: hypothetical protein VLX68_01175 [Chitinivibrionales bacterium]|nr:hypothetical protein [Chitinivibrionales bacterium]